MAQFIQSKRTEKETGHALVIDILGAVCKNPVSDGTMLDAFPKKTKKADPCNQLWTKVDLGSSSDFFILSNMKDENGHELVIAIQNHRIPLPGESTPLVVAKRLSSSGVEQDSQLWRLDPNDDTGFSFIRSKRTDKDGHHLVIAIHHGNTTSGTPLDVFNQLSGSGKESQLWMFVSPS